jgi:hypothetical protein
MAMDISFRTTIASNGNGVPARYGYFSPDAIAAVTAEGYVDRSMGFRIKDQVFVRLQSAPTQKEAEYVVAAGTTDTTKLKLVAATAPGA